MKKKTRLLHFLKKLKIKKAQLSGAEHCINIMLRALGNNHDHNHNAFAWYIMCTLECTKHHSKIYVLRSWIKVLEV